MVEVKGKMIGNRMALVGDKESGFDLLEELERDGDFMTNGKVRIRCGKEGLEESSWKVWEDEEMVDTFVDKKEDQEKEEEVEDVDMDISGMLESVKGERWAMEKEEREVKKEKSVEVVDLCESSEGERGVGLLEEWKEEKKVKERREKEERRKREVEGMVNRGKDRGMGRKEVMEMKLAFGDYEEMVGDMGYHLGIETGLARCFVMDREIRKVMEMMVNGVEEKERGVRRMRGSKSEEVVLVRSEVVVEEGLKEKEEMKRMNGVKGGRTYEEVLKVVGEGIENKEVNEKMEKERMSWVEDSIERERRSGRVVEVIMDWQEESSGKKWKKEEVTKELGVAEGSIDKVKVVGNRVKMVMKDNEVVEVVQKKIEEKGDEVMGGGVVEVKRNENWVELVVLGMSVEMWEGNMELLKEYMEVENDIKLMRMPRWLANEDRRKSMRLKSVGWLYMWRGRV